jgi:cell division protein FtsA
VATDQYLIAIDVGSSSVKLAVASRNLDEKGRTQIYALLEKNVYGINKGVITDMTEISQAVYDIVAEAESVIGVSIREVLIGVNSFGVEFVSSEGFVPISGQEVESQDVDRVVYDSLKKAFNLREKEILQFLPISFSMDNQVGIKNPIGLIGERLSCRTLTITAEPSVIRNFVRIFHQAELDIVDKLYMPFITSELLINSRQKNSGAILVDLGYTTTSYVVWQNDEIIGNGIINIGSEKISSDLAYATQTSIEIADEIKKNNINLIDNANDGLPNEVEIFDPETHTNYILNLRQIRQYAQERVEEIFTLLMKDLYDKFGKTKFSGGIVLIGGGANLKGIHDIVRSTTGLPVYKTVYNEKEVKFILDFNNDPTYCNVVSMLIYALNHPEDIGQDRNVFDNYTKPNYAVSNKRKSQANPIINFFKSILPSKD